MRRAALVLTAIVVLGGHEPSGAQTPPAPAAGTGAADVHLVAGTWSGVAHRGQRDDYVELRIRADHTYEMVSARQIGVFRGRGVLVPTARGFELRSERGGVGALGLERDAGGEVILRLKATLDTGQHVSADLRRSR